MGRALFTLVREDTLDTTEDLAYSTTNSTALSRDEIELVDPYGDPCARPSQQGEEDLDISHNYADGSIGNTPIALRHALALDINYIDSKTMQRLKEWKQERARVLFTPGFGRHTEIAWRPLVSSGTSISDLTGKHTLDINGDANNRNYVWDNISEQDIMRSGGFADKQRIISTPGGAGQVFERAHENLMSPDAPEDGNPGWGAGGTASGTLTISYAENEFGHASCPDAAHVVGTATTDDRYILHILPGSGSDGPDGEGTVNAAIWIHGRVPTDAVFLIYDTTNPTHIIGQIDLDGDYSDWTRIDLQGNSPTFTDGGVSLRIQMPAGSDDQTCDFYIGSTVITWQASASRYSQAYPQWQTEGAARTVDYLTTDAHLTYPNTGTISTSFYVPDWYDPQDSMAMCLCGMSANTSGRLYMVAYDNYTQLRAIFYLGDTLTVEGDVTLVAGAVNTITATWDHDTSQIYHNGALLGERTTAAYYEKTFDQADYFRIGYNNVNSGAWPCIMNTVRLERAVWSAARVANEHETLSNPGSINAIVASRGRTYMIDRLPTDHFTTAGATYWRGQLVIRQVDYTATLADITTKET